MWLKRVLLILVCALALMTYSACNDDSSNETVTSGDEQTSDREPGDGTSSDVSEDANEELEDHDDADDGIQADEPQTARKSSHSTKHHAVGANLVFALLRPTTGRNYRYQYVHDA